MHAMPAPLTYLHLKVLVCWFRLCYVARDSVPDRKKQTEHKWAGAIMTTSCVQRVNIQI